MPRPRGEKGTFGQDSWPKVPFSTPGGYAALWDSLLPIGRDTVTGGYHRYTWTPTDQEVRAWFRTAAADRGMPVEVDRNGNLWAWWGEPEPGSVVTGSHLDSVPNGGAFDGPLGIVSAFAALDLIRETRRTSRPIAIVCFAEEEGARFGIPCVGSRLLTGLLDPEEARMRTDDGGVTLAEAMRSAGHDPAWLGRDEEALRRIGTFVELHIEQGRVLDDLGAPVGVASGIWPHGRWRLEFVGRSDHAGTTRLADRNDPMLPFARTVIAARDLAAHHDALATIGRVQVEPNGTNAIPARVRAWLDVRTPREEAVREIVTELTASPEVIVTPESWSPRVEFPLSLRDRIVTVLGEPPALSTGAGHDAGILATAGVDAAMIFVRNPTGVSHSPDEYAADEDCGTGVEALAAVLVDLAGR